MEVIWSAHLGASYLLTFTVSDVQRGVCVAHCMPVVFALLNLLLEYNTSVPPSLNKEHRNE